MLDFTCHTLTELSDSQEVQYRQAIETAFPAIISQSAVIHQYWEKIEQYFPDHQIFLIDNAQQIIGFANTIPCYWDKPIDELPREGWDWMVKQGISNYEQHTAANMLGGLQIIITTKYLSKGYSKIIIQQLKKLKANQDYAHLAIPIRPIWKHKYPAMKMSDYLLMEADGKTYDPWIRTHLKSGAEIVNVCENSMNFKGDITFWKSMLHEEINASGLYTLPGALNQIQINIEENTGEYREENIWVYYK